MQFQVSCRVLPREVRPVARDRTAQSGLSDGSPSLTPTAAITDGCQFTCFSPLSTEARQFLRRLKATVSLPNSYDLADDSRPHLKQPTSQATPDRQDEHIERAEPAPGHHRQDRSPLISVREVHPTRESYSICRAGSNKATGGRKLTRKHLQRGDRLIRARRARECILAGAPHSLAGAIGRVWPRPASWVRESLPSALSALVTVVLARIGTEAAHRSHRPAVLDTQLAACP